MDESQLNPKLILGSDRFCYASFMMKLRSLLLAASGVFMSGVMTTVPTAQALSCAQPDIVRELEWAKASDKVYYLFVGTVSTPKTFRLPQEKHLENSLPQQKPRPSGGVLQLSHPDRSQTLNATFTGYSMAKDERSDVQLKDYPLTLKVTCAASWCGSAPRRGETIIAFVEAVDGAPPVLMRGPCTGSGHIYNPNVIETLRNGL